MWAGEHDKVWDTVLMRACGCDVDDARVTGESHAMWMRGQLWNAGCDATCKDGAQV